MTPNSPSQSMSPSGCRSRETLTVDVPDGGWMGTRTVPENGLSAKGTDNGTFARSSMSWPLPSVVEAVAGVPEMTTSGLVVARASAVICTRAPGNRPPHPPVDTPADAAGKPAPDHRLLATSGTDLHAHQDGTLAPATLDAVGRYCGEAARKAATHRKDQTRKSAT